MLNIDVVVSEQKASDQISLIFKEFPQFAVTYYENIDDLIQKIQKLELKYLVIDSATWKNMRRTCIGIKGLLLNTKCLLVLEKESFYTNEELEEFYDFFGSTSVLDLSLSLLKRMTKAYDFLLKEENAYLTQYQSLVPVQSTHFTNLKASPCDIFLKMSQEKYLKVINAQDSDAKVIIEKYKAKGVKEFYIDLIFYKHFKSEIIHSLFENVNNEVVTPEKQVQITSQVLNIASDFGVTEVLIEGINQTFKEINADFSNKKSLNTFLDRLKNLDGTILGNHSYLLSVILMEVSKNLPWCSKEVKKNLLTAALLHDLELVNSGYEHLEFKALKDIPKEDKESFHFIKNHTVKLAELFSKNDEIKSDVINLILKHHESSDGHGYPRGLSAPQMSPPNHLFNVAHQFSIELFNIGFNYSKLDEVFNKLKIQFPNQTYSIYIDLIEKQFKLI